MPAVEAPGRAPLVQALAIASAQRTIVLFITPSLVVWGGAEAYRSLHARASTASRRWFPTAALATETWELRTATANTSQGGSETVRHGENRPQGRAVPAVAV